MQQNRLGHVFALAAENCLCPDHRIPCYDDSGWLQCFTVCTARTGNTSRNKNNILLQCFSPPLSSIRAITQRQMKISFSALLLFNFFQFSIFQIKKGNELADS